MSDMPYADEKVGATLRSIENAIGIVQLRLCSQEWANTQGEQMAGGAPTKSLLTFIAVKALELRGTLP